MIKLLRAVVNRIDKLFPNINIYVRDVEQGLVEPCFFVSIVNTDITPEFQKRYRVDSLVNIVYLDQRADAFLKEEIEQTLLYRMHEVFLDTGGVYSFKSESRIKDDSINFVINYRYTTKEKVFKEPFMMEIENIIHYTEKEPYKKATDKSNPGMWESEPWPDNNKVFPGINPMDPRYENDEDDEEDLMRKKEVNIHGR
ncbi:hypothetical protein ABID14_000215 [Peptoniphilus olsenii]|uniref:Uncharacterized protein n=1 Tax=Peptoniphilus olsenii TaxID=411570 RepID=A0ABV2J9K7_9FIRM